MLNTSVLLIVFILGLLAGGISMYLAGMVVKNRFIEEAERRKKIAVSRESRARRERAGHSANLN
jgi:membrane protein DedA with SNARE-associated domain